MSILAEYRWYFLIGAEIVFWLSAIGYRLLFTSLRIPFEEGELYYGDCTPCK